MRTQVHDAYKALKPAGENNKKGCWQKDSKFMGLKNLTEELSLAADSLQPASPLARLAAAHSNASITQGPLPD